MHLLETIFIKNGVIQNLSFHQERFERTFFELFTLKTNLNLSEIIEIKEDFKQKNIRCRIIYNEKGIETILYPEYIYKSIKTLRIVQAPKIDYAYKFENREIFSNILTESNSDEVIILQANLITDCCIGNLAFFNGKSWKTPAFPLLKGTKRAKLLKENKILEENIQATDLAKFSKLAIINAFRDLEDETNHFLISEILS